MSHAPIDEDAFNRFEHAGWEKVADPYHRFWAPVTGRVIDPLLDDAGVAAGSRVLDVATGPGHVAARAADRSASVTGLDIAHQMLALASTLHPSLEFRHGSVEELPFPDAVFDAVVGNFVILHVGRPDRAVAECARVLKPGGRLAFSVWDVPEKARILGIFVDAVQLAGATPPASVPLGPPFFRFAEDREFSELLKGAGLSGVGVRRVAFTHRLSGADAWWHGALDGAIRTTALIRSQTPEMQARIRSAFDSRAHAYATGDGFEVPVSVKLASGRKRE